MTNKQTNAQIKETYNPKLLQSNFTSNFITIPQTTVNYEELHQALSEFKHTQYLITKLEQHEDKGLHIHILITLKQVSRLTAIHKIIMSHSEDHALIGGTIDYQKPKHIGKSITYVKKEDTSVEGKPFLEYGELGTNHKRQTYNNDNNEALLEAIAKAEQGDTEEALQDIKQIDPMKYLQFKETFKTNLTSENKTVKKYELPNMNKTNVKLNPQQQKVWEHLQSTPQARKIIWVSGDYGSGKSYLYNYIKANHDYGMYDAGQSASMDNVAYGYNEEGVIAWDLPRTFNFTEMGDSIANVIEKFSDFGQSITSKKYSGKTQHVRGHVIVFSNQQPLEQLKHRNIIHINLTGIKDIKEKPIKKDHPDMDDSQPVYEIVGREHEGPVNSNSDNEEELTIFTQATANPNISKLTKGTRTVYKTNYREYINGPVKSKLCKTEAEATKLIDDNYASIY